MPREGTKKRKRDAATAPTPVEKEAASNGADYSRPTAVFRPAAHGRPWTVSLALPGSVVANAQTHDAKTALCGGVARAAAVFCVDELVLFDDGCDAMYQKRQDAQHAAQDAQSGYSAFADARAFMQHVLAYLEAPPALRRALFPHHPNLRTAGSLPSVDMPSHLRESEWCRYREGVTVASSSPGTDTYVQAGLREPIPLDPPPEEPIPLNTRVTLRFPDGVDRWRPGVMAEAVDPALPREEGGYYWGYSTRLAASVTDVFTECPFEGGYDYTIGTSERGVPLREFLATCSAADDQDQSDGTPAMRNLPRDWNHLLIVFGGPPGLEKAVENDRVLAEKGIGDASQLFDAWVNLVEQQGSRTIRTEEALWIGLMGFQEITRRRNAVNKRR